MKPFEYEKATDVPHALTLLAERPNARFLGGGTNLVDLVRRGVETPDSLVDVTGLPLSEVEETPDGGLRVGAVVTNADLAHDPLVRTRYPLLSQAVLAGASGQLRNMATVGGNLLQRTRCAYFTDLTAACNKREPGSGCAARDGENRLHAIFGASLHCIATHASDLAVALLALDARVHVRRHESERVLPIAELYRVPGDTPQRDSALEPGELIVAVEVPAAARRSCYLKVRDRASFEFAVVSVAVALEVEDGVIRSARLAAGGVGTVPWRLLASEQALAGTLAGPAAFDAAAAHAGDGAEPLSQNGFKIELLRRTVRRALELANG